MVGIIHGNELRKTEETEGQALGKPLLTIQGETVTALMSGWNATGICFYD